MTAVPSNETVECAAVAPKTKPFLRFAGSTLVNRCSVAVTTVGLIARLNENSVRLQVAALDSHPLLLDVFNSLGHLPVGYAGAALGVIAAKATKQNEVATVGMAIGSAAAANMGVEMTQQALIPISGSTFYDAGHLAETGRDALAAGVGAALQLAHYAVGRQRST